MQKQQNPEIKQVLSTLITTLTKQSDSDVKQQDATIQTFIIDNLLSLIGNGESVLTIARNILTDPDISTPFKHIVLIYFSLIGVTSDKISDLAKFYYELTSHAIKQLKQKTNKQSSILWNTLFQKIYQFGIYLLIGNKSILLNMGVIQKLIRDKSVWKKASEMRLNRLVKIYNCLICIPEQYLSLKETLYFTLLFTRWQESQSGQDEPFGHTFFASFMIKTQNKLIRKLKKYPMTAFTQEHILNLIKIILGGDQLIFSYFLQIKYSYQAVKINYTSSFRTQNSIYDAIRKCPVVREGRHLFNFIIETLANQDEQAILKNAQREAIIYVCLKFLSGKYQNNEQLFIILAKRLLHEKNEVVFQMSFRFIREQAMQYLTVHKVKILLNMFNNQNWQSFIIKHNLSQQQTLQRLQLIIALLTGIARRYSQSSLVLYCQSQNYGVQIKYSKNIRSVIMVVAFDGIGRLSQSNKLEMLLMRIYLSKQFYYQVSITFSQNIQAIITDAISQPKQRMAKLIIKDSKNNIIVNERKQYLKFGETCFESLVTVSFLGKQQKSIAFCIDGAYYQFGINKKPDIVQIRMGNMIGSIRTFYALKVDIQLINFHKVWCEEDRKAKSLVQSLGTQNIVYKLNNREQPIITDYNTNFGFFQNKTQFIFKGVAVKHITFIDILLQLGGLQTIFFIMERFSRSLLHFQRSQEKINVLLAQFFHFLRVAASLDQSVSFLDDLLQCFQYFNQFLFLLIKRNKMVRESHNSALLLSIFQLLIYFRRYKIKNSTFSFPVRQKMAQIQIAMVLQTLANFQIWSSCSINLQLFVLSQIQSYIKQGIHCAAFIKKDLHKQLLSNIILFQTSDGILPHHSQIHHRLIELCFGLYEQSKDFILSSEQLKELTDNTQEIYESFVQRDINTCMSLIQVLLQHRKDRQFTDSQKSAYQILIKYFINNFVINRVTFNVIGKIWNLIAFTFCSMIDNMQRIEVTVIWQSLQVLISLSSMDQGFDIWIIRFIQILFQKQQTNFNDCLFILCKVLQKYVFETSRKQLIINNIINGHFDKLQNKLISLEWVVRFKQVISTVSAFSLYKLSTNSDFCQLFQVIKRKLFASTADKRQSSNFMKGLQQSQIDKQVQKQQKLKQYGQQINKIVSIWIYINQNMLQLLYGDQKITNLNKQFIKILIANIYQFQPQHHIAICPLDQLLQSLHQVRDLAKTSQVIENNRYIKLGIQSAFALIQHCHSWPILYFLLHNGLITTNSDITIPFKIQQFDRNSYIGGTLAYYLSFPSSPIQLYVIFIIALYRQLSNNISLLTCQVNIAIFQYSIEYLLDNVKCKRINGQILEDDKEVYANTGLLIVLLKEVVKSLNSRFIIRLAVISKDIQKLIGVAPKKMQYADWKKKKGEETIQMLCKAANKIQVALQQDKIDKDMSFFLQHIFDKLTLVNQIEGKHQILQIIQDLIQQMKFKNISYTELHLKKLAITGVRFFQISREYFITKNVQTIFDKKKEFKRIDKLPQITKKQQQYYNHYLTLLTQKFDKILLSLYQRGQSSQQTWQNLMISNEHWFNLQEDIDDVTTKFYQLDEKQIGPYGFYKLNIKPVKADHQKLPYPRRKEYKEMLSKKEEEKEIDVNAMQHRHTIQHSSSTLFSTISQNSIMREKSALSHNPALLAIQQSRMKQSKRQVYCELVTKRGVYAGLLRKYKQILQFVFIGHSNLPKQRQYQMSTNKCHQIQQLSDWQQQQLKSMKILLPGTKIFTRRYIMRHTAFQIMYPLKHRTYFFNVFYRQTLWSLMNELKGDVEDVIDDRVEGFKRGQFTLKWQRGELSNFQYICMINRYSGRTYNDLAQYPVMPWVISNFDGKGGVMEINKDFYKSRDNKINYQNFRDLTVPTGKLNIDKFNKLKARLRQVDASDRQIRFLFGSMYSNPTVLYNFFIRLQPFTSLHWQHQGRKIDHADRLFSGVAEQFSTVITSSSDNKELCPQFYYWTQFLRNRNKIQLGRRQRGDDVDAVVLPAWARSPEQFIFKMRQVLQSSIVSSQLHHWIDLIFGYKSPFHAAEDNDNLYHFQCYEHDLFEQYETENQMKIAQITISQFGQIPEQIFFEEHPPRNKNARKDMEIDKGAVIHQGNGITGYQFNQVGLLIWGDQETVIKKAAIPGLFHSFSELRSFPLKGKICFLMSVNNNKWISLNSGLLRVIEKGKIKMEKSIEAKCIDSMGTYIFYGKGSKIGILKITNERIEDYGVLYGHRDEVILIKTQYYLDVIISVDRSGFVLVHELTELRFLRAFQIGTDFQGDQSQKLRISIHRMGYYIFLDHNQTIWIFNYMGELLLEQDLQTRTNIKGEEQKISQIQLWSHQHSILLLGSSKGNIFQLNFLDVIRFRDTYPFKTFSRLDLSVLAGVRSKNIEDVAKRAIKQFSVIKTSVQTNPVYQILVLYESGHLVCYTEQKEMGKQLQTNQRLKSMGFF